MLVSAAGWMGRPNTSSPVRSCDATGRSWAGRATHRLAWGAVAPRPTAVHRRDRPSAMSARATHLAAPRGRGWTPKTREAHSVRDRKETPELPGRPCAGAPSRLAGRVGEPSDVARNAPPPVRGGDEPPGAAGEPAFVEVGVQGVELARAERLQAQSADVLAGGVSPDARSFVIVDADGVAHVSDVTHGHVRSTRLADKPRPGNGWSTGEGATAVPIPTRCFG